jgi:hypothetical protein
MLLIILVLAISIGFAALATTLKIDGSALVKKSTWNIYWDNARVTQGSASQDVPNIGKDQGDPDNTKITWTVNLSVPGEYYEFLVDAVNAGSVDAAITNIEGSVSANNDNTPSNLPGYIDYTVTYQDGTAVLLNDPLAKADSSTTPATPTKKTYKVRVEFLNTITPEEMAEIPEGGFSYDFEYDVTYGQPVDMTPGAVALRTVDSDTGEEESILNKTPEELRSKYGEEITGFKTIYPIKWQLFHSDDDYIYLITMGYLDQQYLPTELDPGDYECGSYSAVGNYTTIMETAPWSSGSSSTAFTANPISNKYLKWKNVYSNSTNNNIKATAYMMDTNVWSSFAGNAAGAFAMGGPTIELFADSYNAANYYKITPYDELRKTTDYDSYSDQNKYANVSQTGYYLKFEPYLAYSDGYNYTSRYIPKDTMWAPTCGKNTLYFLASPSAGGADYLVTMGCYGDLNYRSVSYSGCGYAYRPVVAIPKSSIR